MSKTRTKKAFTLAETLITLTILGVIAAITVPGLVRRQVEAANRTKIKKAMRSYDLAINKMVVENGLKNDEALVSFAGDENNNCAGSSSYFKQAEGTGCVFKTSDGVWWDISDIQKTIIALDDDDLDEATAESDTNRAFYFQSWFDRNGTLRVNDLAAAQDKDRLQALYDYIYGKTKMSNAKENRSISLSESINNVKTGKYDTKCENPNGRINCTNCFSCFVASNGEISYFDENGLFVLLENDYVVKITTNNPENRPFDLSDEEYCINCDEYNWVYDNFEKYDRSTRPNYISSEECPANYVYDSGEYCWTYE